MTVNWIRKPARIEMDVTFVRHFVSLIDPSTGFAFDSDAQGVPALKTPESAANFERALAGVAAGTMEDRGAVAQDEGRSYWDAGAIRCAQCGRTVELSGNGYDDTCACGAEYNGAGQRLSRTWRQDCAGSGEFEDL